MDILIVGAGAIGIAVGTTLVQSGQQVTFLARGETARAIASGGIRRTGLFGDVAFPASSVTVAEDYDALPPDGFDFILISVKTLANEAVSDALAAHRSIMRPQCRLVLLQNGWGNDQAYLRHFSKEQICSGRVITGFQRTAPNVSNITVHTAETQLGSLYGLDVSPLAPLAKAINDGGLPCETTDDIVAALWAKMLYNCTLNPLGAVLGVPYGGLAKSPCGLAIMEDIIEEIYAVMDAAGYRTFWPTPEEYKKVFFGKLLPDTAGHNSSTLQDIRAKHPTEIDTLTGRVLELAAAHGVAAPVNTMLYRQIKTMEANY